MDNKEIIKTIRRKNREEEISLYGKQIYFRSLIERNRRLYTRKTKHKEKFHLNFDQFLLYIIIKEKNSPMAQLVSAEVLYT